MLASFVDPLVDLVLPRSCAGCDRPVTAWCRSCRAPLGPRAASVGGLPVVAAIDYAGPARRVLLAYKERGRRDLAAPIAALLALAVRAALVACGVRPSHALLVCVPSTRDAAARRGGDHLARLAARAGRITGVRVVPGVLSVRRTVRDSAGLSATDRAGNLAGAMQAAVRPADPRGRRPRQVIVIDDIVTSGATLREARRALLAGGWPVVGAAAFAATPLTAGGTGVTWSLTPRPTPTPTQVQPWQVSAHPLAPPR